MSMKKIFKNKGIVLITILLLLTIVIMTCTLMTVSASNQMKMGRHYLNSEQAHYAALSALEYARSRVYADEKWMKAGVEEFTEYYGSSGNVIKVIETRLTDKAGVVRAYFGGDETKHSASFSMAFLDLSGIQADPDTEPDQYKQEVVALAKGSKIPNDINFISSNAMADEKSYCVLRRNSNTKDFEIYRSNIPSGTMYLVAEGNACGAIKCAEAYVRLTSVGGIESTSMARGSIQVDFTDQSSSFAVTSANNSDKTSVRTMGEIIFNREDSKDTSGRKNFFTLANDGVAYGNDFLLNGKGLSKLKDFEEYGINIDISPDQIAKTGKMLNGCGKDMTFAELANTADKDTIKPGAYIFLPPKEGSNDKGRWRFIAPDSNKIETISYSAISIDCKDQTIIVSDAPDYNGLKFTSREDMFGNIQGVIEVTGSVRCDGNLYFGAYDEILTDKKKATIPLSTKQRVTMNFNGEDAVLKMAGDRYYDNSGGKPKKQEKGKAVKNFPYDKYDFYKMDCLMLAGTITGKGKIYSNGDIYCQGGTFFDTQKNSGVSIYAEEDVTILPAINEEKSIEIQKINNCFDKNWGAIVKFVTGKNFEDFDRMTEELLSKCKINYENSNMTISDFFVKKIGVAEENVPGLMKSTLLRNGITEKGVDSSSVIEDGFKGLYESDINLLNSIELYNYETSNLLDPYGLGYANGYRWENNGGDYSLTINYKKGAYEVIDPKTLNREIIKSNGFIEIWVHQSGRNNDLFVYVPVEQSINIGPKGEKANNGAPYNYVFARMGYDRQFGSPNDSETYYNQEMFVSVSTQVPNSYKMDDTSNQVSVDLPAILDMLSLKGGWSITGGESLINIKCINLDGTKNMGAELKNSTVNMETQLRTNFKYTEKAFDGNPDRKAVDDFVLQLDPDNKSVVSVGSLRESEFSLNDFKSIRMNDVIVKGMIFTRKGDFNMPNAVEGTFTLVGGIVAYGEDEKGGNIHISNASGIEFRYDPDYMRFFYGQGGIVTDYLYRMVF